MKNKEIVGKKYDNLHEQIKNIIITPKGELLDIQSQSHDYYLEKKIKEEFDMDIDKLSSFKQLAIEEGARGRPSVDEIIIAKYGYVSIHTSGRGIGWIRIPSKINEEQMSVIKTEYALGNLPDLLYNILINYEEIISPIKEMFGDRRWWRPYQIEIDFANKKRSYITDIDVKNGYYVHAS